MSIKEDFLRLSKERFIILDGAMGTQIQGFELGAEDFWHISFESDDTKSKDLNGCNEALNISKPNIIESIHQKYIDAGANLITTNSFGAMPWVLDEYGIKHKTYEICKASALNVKNAIKHSGKANLYTLGSLGPGTKLPSLGHIDFIEMCDGYKISIKGLLDGGADIILFETCQDPLQIKAGIVALKSVEEEYKQEIPLMISITIESTLSMLIGTDIPTIASILEPYDVLSIGINCGLGPKEIEPFIKELRTQTNSLLSLHANAGLPENRDGATYYPMDKDSFAIQCEHLATTPNLCIIGGCCGTTPTHIAKLQESLKGKKPLLREKKIDLIPSVASLYTSVALSQEPSPLLIGERSNATGSKAFRDMLLNDDLEGVLKVATDQEKSGAHVLDVSVGYAGRDEREDMKRVVSMYAKTIRLPLMIDSTQYDALEIGLQNYGGRPIINSANLENGIERFDKVAKLAKLYGAALVCLSIDEVGMAKDMKHKVAICQKMMDRAINIHHLREQDILFDVLTFTIGSGDSEYFLAGEESLKAIDELKRLYPKAGSVLGLSNISFGLSKNGRIFLNSVFLHHAINYNLSAAILNVSHILPLSKMDKEDIQICEELIFNHTSSATPLHKFIEYFDSKETNIESKVENIPQSTEDKIEYFLINGDWSAMKELLPKAKDSIPADVIINRHLMDGMKVVGERFGAGEMQLPFVLLSAECMKKSVDYLNDFLPKVESEGKKLVLVLGTVKGDVHDVGKNLVDIILSNNGFKVINIGIKADISLFIQKMKEHNADALGMSGLLVKSTQVMKENLAYLKSQGIKIPVMLGGAALNRAFVQHSCQNEYDGVVVYCKDVFDSLAMLKNMEKGVSGDELKKTPSLKNKDISQIPQKIQSQKVEIDRDKIPVFTDLGGFTPPFIDRVDIIGKNMNVSELKSLYDEVYKYLDIDLLFKSMWGYGKKGLKKDEYEKMKQTILEPQLNELKSFIWESGAFSPIIIYGYFNATPFESGLDIHGVKMHFARSSKEPYLSISDYYDKKGDILPLSLTSIGHTFAQIESALYEDGEYHRYFLLHALGAALTEALAEMINTRICIELGLDGIQGCRYSFGYPACPDLSQNEKIFELLEPQRYGISLSENHQMHPELTTCAVITPYKNAKYFAI